MRRFLLCALAGFALFAPGALAQTFDFTPFLTLNDPTLQVSYAPVVCTVGADPSGCGSLPGYLTPESYSPPGLPNPARPIGTDSAGSVYVITGVTGSFYGQAGVDRPTGSSTAVMYRMASDGSTEGRIGTINLLACLDPSCATWDWFGAVSGPWIDPVGGTMLMFIQDARGPCTWDCIPNYCTWSCDAYVNGYVRVTITGLPKLFDTLLTFVPGGALVALTPGLPDGFRSADSLQVWTGNVRSMPNWSQAQPLTCSAATSPTPGQVVTVPDTLADPTVGTGRYYVVASQSGGNRRLGRQYVNGAFSARDPSGLPACQ